MIQTHTPVMVRIQKWAETNLLGKGITKRGKLLHFRSKCTKKWTKLDFNFLL